MHKSNEKMHAQKTDCSMSPPFGSIKDPMQPLVHTVLLSTLWQKNNQFTVDSNGLNLVMSAMLRTNIF